jgi:hypothetical protein
METKTVNHKDELQKAVAIAKACRLNLISYDEAKKICEVHLKPVNDKISEIAKRFGKKPFKYTFTGLLR